MNQKIVNSIKVWSVVVGVLSLSSLLTLSVYPLTSLTGLLSALAIIFGLAVLYAGLQVQHMKLKTVGGIFWTKFALLILNLLLSISYKEVSVVRLLIIVAQGIIVWYLIMSLKKVTAMPHPQG